MSQETVSHSKEVEEATEEPGYIRIFCWGEKNMQSNVKKSLLITKNRHLNVFNVFLYAGRYKTQFITIIP